MKLHPQFFDYVRALNPNVDLRRDVIVSMDGDEVVSIEWNLSGKPPTDKEIDAANPPPFVQPKSIFERVQLLEAKTAGLP